MRLRLAFSAVLGILVLASALIAGVAPALAVGASVTIKGFTFQPATTTIHRGQSITWANQDAEGHNATALDGSFQTPPIAAGSSASVTFKTVGTFAYYCTIHPTMRASVVVVDAPAPATDAVGSSAPTSRSPIGALMEALAAVVSAALLLHHARRRGSGAG